jgi:DNA mismatch endonuclease, patch repair protein
MDIYGKSKRSQIMASVRGRDSAIELLTRRTLHRAGFRYRLHAPDLPGRPDIVLPRHRQVVFVHGCFWHQHQGCQKARLPEANRDFWEGKLGRNVERDRAAQAELERHGWRVTVVWECECRRRDFAEWLVGNVQEAAGRP